MKWHLLAQTPTDGLTFGIAHRNPRHLNRGRKYRRTREITKYRLDQAAEVLELRHQGQVRGRGVLMIG
jgi:hypothetical protein